MLKNQKFKELIKLYVEKYALNLANYNVMVPFWQLEPELFAYIAGCAGAKNIYIYNPKMISVVNAEKSEFNIGFISSCSCEILSDMDIILKGSEIKLEDNKILSFLNSKCAVTMFPENLDFANTEGIDINFCKNKKIPIISLAPNESKIGLYEHFSHVIMKRLYKSGIDVYSSKILLMGSGDFLNITLALLKSSGSIVYTYNTAVTGDYSYISKHLPELDAVVIMDYPAGGKQIIGSKGFINISDIVDTSPNIKVFQICGETELNSLKLGNIKYFPENFENNSLNINIKELGERGIVEIATACLKTAEIFKNPEKKSLHFNKSVVTYKLLTGGATEFLFQCLS